MDDERLARAELRRLLLGHKTVEVVGEAANADEAEEQLRQLGPELMFLDIQMPGGSRFDLLERLERVPRVVFTTAFDEYAIRAFEVNALDYLLKPIRAERLAEALLRAAEAARSISAEKKPGVAERLFIRDGERCWFVEAGEIELLESEGNYTRVWFGKERPLVLSSLNAVEERLGAMGFYRVSRKHIVALKAIQGVEPSVAGGLLVRLQNGREVEMSRRRAAEFRKQMGLG